MRRREEVEVVMKSRAAIEEPGVLGIETENKSHAKDIKALERRDAVLVNILLQQFVVNDTDEVSRFDRDLHLSLEVRIAFIDEELQAIVFFLEVFEQYDLRLAVRLLHVIDPELGKIAGDDPPRTLAVWQFGGIAFGLLERVENGAV